MASAVDPLELSEGELNEIVEKFRQAASVQCFGTPTLYIACARLLVQADLHKDLEMDGMPIGTKDGNFLNCVKQAVGQCTFACAWLCNWLYTYKSTFSIISTALQHYIKDQDIPALKQRCDGTENKNSPDGFDALRTAQTLIAEVYVRYWLTKLTVNDTIIEILASIRQEVVRLIEIWSFIRSLFSEIFTQLNDILGGLHNISVQQLTKLYCNFVCFQILAEIVCNCPSIDHYTESHKWVAGSTKIKYPKYETMCLEAAADLKVLIEDGENQLRTRICDNICVRQ